MRKVLLLIVLVLLGCQQGPSEFRQYSGEEGIEILFGGSAPPSEVYEQFPIPMNIILHNKGADPVRYEDMIITFNTDPLYVKNGLLKINPSEMDIANSELPGKSIGYPDGLDRMYAVPSEYFYAKAVPGTRKEPITSIQASACYRYTTTFTTSVCIDTSGYQGNERTQSCEQKDIIVKGGQGAPVSITKVEIESIPIIDPLIQGESIQPHFTIHFENAGSGRVIGPSSLELDNACILKNMPREEIGAIEIRAWLLNSELECLPSNTVQLFQGEADVRCTVGKEDLSKESFIAKQNFQTVLTVNASYIYKSSVSKEIAIQRTGQAELPSIGEISGYHYENGVPVTTQCSYYASNPERAPAGIRERIKPGFSCSCTESQCTFTREKLTCLPALCPGATYCCYKDSGENNSSTGP